MSLILFMHSIIIRIIQHQAFIKLPFKFVQKYYQYSSSIGEKQTQIQINNCLNNCKIIRTIQMRYYDIIISLLVIIKITLIKDNKLKIDENEPFYGQINELGQKQQKMENSDLQIEQLMFIIYQFSYYSKFPIYSSIVNYHMLKSALSPHKSPKIHQYILRRRARNLRAKVKALLPAQICCKHDHRNRCVKDIESNKKAWECLHNNNKWTMTVQKQNTYYYENQPCVDHVQRFQKLTDLQIQQIKEDRLYYLGEENLQDFQLFLQQKYKIKENKDTNQKDKNMNVMASAESQMHQHNLNRTFSSIMLRRIPQAIINLMNRRRNSQQSENFDDQQNSCFQTEKNEKTSKFQMSQTFNKKKKKSVDQKLKQFDERRKIIEYQQKSKILVDKVKLNMRLQRAQGIAKQKKAKKLSQLQQRRIERQQHLQRITSRRRNQENQGQIKQLQEKLRRTFLDRKCQTTNKNWRNLRTNFI